MERTFEFVGTRLRRVTDDAGTVLLERRFDEMGMVTEARHLEGVLSTWLPDGVLEVHRERQGGGPAEVVRYRPDALGRVVEIDGPDGRLQYIYEGASSRLIAVRTSEGAETAFRYDEQGLLREVEDPDGHRVRLTRNSDGLPESIEDGVVTQRFDYDSSGRITHQSYGQYLTRYRYDEVGRPTSESTGDAIRAYRYDDAGRLDRLADPQGVQQLRYDDVGRLIEVSDTTNETVRLTWDGDGAPKASVDGFVRPNEDTTGVELIPTDRVITGMAAGDSTFRDESGNLVAFDPRGRPLAIQTSGGVMRRHFDGDGRLAALSLPDGRSFEIERSPAGRPTVITDDAGRRTQMSWNGAYLDRLVTPSGVELEYSWNSAGQLATVAAGPLRWTYRYDDHGNLAEVATPEGVVRYEWDLAGRPARTTSPNGSQTTYEWAGELLQAVTAEGDELIALEWDELDRISRIATLEGEERFVYDETGNLASHELSGHGEVAYAYLDGRVAEVRTGSRTESWIWTGDSVSEVRVGDDPDDRYSLVWAHPGQIERIDREGSPVVAIERNDAGLPVSVTAADDDGPEGVASFAWAADRSLTSAEIDGEQLRVRTDPDGRIIRARTNDAALEVAYQDGAPTSILGGDTRLTFDYREGALSRSTLEHDDERAALDWDAGRRISSFMTSEGDGRFEYLSDGRVDTIAYDDDVREVSYGDGRADSSGTGDELLDALFDDAGHATAAAAAVAVGPRVPYFELLPPELGVSLPTVATAPDVVDAFLGANVPLPPSPLIGDGDPEGLALRAADAILLGAATFDIPTGPTTSTEITLTPRTDQLEQLLQDASTTVAAASILEHLSPDPCLICRVRGAAMEVLGGIGGGIVSGWRFVRDNPFVQAALTITFLALEGVVPAAGIARAALLLLVLIDPSNVSGSIQSALLAPTQALVRLVSGPSLADVVLVTLAAASVAPVVGGLTRRTPLWSASTHRLVAPSRDLAQRTARFVDQLPCRLDGVVCVSRTRFGPAATHIDDAIATGHGRFLTTDYAGAAARRRDALRGVARFPGLDRDEYPFAFTRQGGTGASVRAIDPSANRAAGAYIRGQLPSRSGYRLLVRTVA
jgi:YD repeat-containing protein